MVFTGRPCKRIAENSKLFCLGSGRYNYPVHTYILVGFRPFFEHRLIIMLLTSSSRLPPPLLGHCVFNYDLICSGAAVDLYLQILKRRTKS